ncbi:hypothetical protein HPB50_023155 [Hyalomma asiaticum]|uniref:Uncharacterized protein n=1 Tax=Hyalomma asiaticum TaxID=266040 RepID=A0ACB7TMA9_HYAAI|nr:hypothetical protein HPB50_023155 [Hyalomma asiaticum]
MHPPEFLQACFGFLGSEALKGEKTMAPLHCLFVFAALLLASTNGLPFTKAKGAAKAKCQRYHALKRFSACGALVGHAVREKSLLENPNQNATCKKAEGFDKCFQESMRSTRCARSSEFSFHLQHISSLVNEMYKESCSSRGETSSMLTDMSTVCDVRVAVVRFLECTGSFYLGDPQNFAPQNHSEDASATTRGVHFGIIFDAPAVVGGTAEKYSRIPSTECRQSAKFRNCIDNIHLYSECGIGTEVHSHLKYLANIVNRKVAGKCSQQTQIPELDCQLLPFLRKFLHCGVNRYETTGDSIDHDICRQVNSYKECVAAAERVTHCNMRNLSLSYHLNYLHNVMTTVNTSCKGVRNVESSVYKETCKRTTLFNNYFSCGMEVQARLEGLKKGDKERCRISENFEKCFINAKEQSGCLLADEATSIMSALLDTWKKEHAKECSDFDVEPPLGEHTECLTGTAVRKVFLCGLSFQTAVREVKFSPLEMSPEVCRRLEEMNSCISEVKSRTKCAMSELHAHVAPLLQPFTTDYVKRCEKMAWSNMSAPMMSPNSPACRRLPALKRIFHCGLSFSRILEEMELVHQKAEVLCPLLKKYETCVPDSASELGCRDDPVMKGHVRSFGRILHRQYYEACLRNRRGVPIRLESLRRGNIRRVNASRVIFGNVNVLRQERKRARNFSAPFKQQMLSQVMEDYYGPDYDEYVEEEDKVPDSLDVKPAYDYADREVTSKTKKQDAPQKSTQLSQAVTDSNSSLTVQKQDADFELRKSQEFWAGVERARKLRSQHRYESGAPELIQDLSSNRVSRDFARPGAYFIDQLGNQPDYDNNNYARKRDGADNSNSNIESQEIPEIFRSSPINLQVYKSIRSVPRAARQGERDVEGWRGVPPLSREEELEMYEDTRGMADLLQKQREGHYSRYNGWKNLGPKPDMQRAGKDPVHRYAASGDEIFKSRLDNGRGLFNSSLAYYDYNGGTDTRRFRGEYGMRHIERYPYIRHYAPNERAGKGQQGDGHEGLRLDRRMVGLKRRGHTYRDNDYGRGEYEKPSLGRLPHTEGEEFMSRDVVSFPEDDAPVLPNDESTGHDMKQMGYHRAFPIRLHDSKVYPDTPRNLQVASGMLDVNYAPRGTFSASQNVLGAKLRRRDGVDTLTEEQISQNDREGESLPYYPRRLASNMFRARAGLPTDPQSAAGILQEEYDRGVRDSLKMSDAPSVPAKEETLPRLNAMKRLSGHDRVSSPNNPNFHLPGETSGNTRLFQRKLPFKKPNYKETEPHEMNSYPNDLRPFPNPPQRRSNDSNYVGPNSFLPEPGLRSPKEKVVPDFLGETQDRAGLPEKTSPRKDESSHQRSAYSPGSHIKGAGDGEDYNYGQESRDDGTVQRGAKGSKRFFDIKKRRREPRLGFPYVRRIDESPGLLLDKSDEAAGSAIAKPPRQNTNLQLNQYELERKRRKQLVNDDLEDIINNHKEDSDSKADMMLFPSEHLVRDDRVVRDFDAKALEDTKDYYEIDAKLESDSEDRSSMWSAGGDDIKEELLRKHIQSMEKQQDPLLGELSKRNAWYTDDIWSDNNDLFGMERLLSGHRRGFADNGTEEDEMSECQLHNLRKRSDACVRVFDDDFKAVGNATIRHFELHSLTPQLRKSVCSHARDFSQCINVFAQKYRCVDSQELIRNLTDDHLKKAGVMFCDASAVRISIKLAISAALLHFLRA